MKRNDLEKKMTVRLTKVFYLMKSQLLQNRYVTINEATLARACTSFWEDILRVKAYHPINRAEKHKKAAYIFKWIAKMRPVKPIVDHVDALTNEEMDANALYAFLCASGYLNMHLVLQKHELKYIFYSATYRDIHPDEWILTFDYMERIYSNI